MTTAILLVEARGQSVHCREDACVNLVQAAFLARELVRAGVDVRIRLIADAGQSIEEYSILCHTPDEAGGFKDRILMAADPRATRYGVVRELRARLPFTCRAVAGSGIEIEDRLFYSPLLSRIDGVNSELLTALRDVVHPLFDASALDVLEELIAAHIGMPYLDLDLAVARRAIAIIAGDAFDSIDISTVWRPDDDPRLWLHEGTGCSMIENDLVKKEGGESGGGFHDRLIGVFASLTPIAEERPYFNSPSCCRAEHGKVRIIARDRFNVLGLSGSERMKFDRFRELLDAQTNSAPERLLAIKYPHTARIIVANVADEAAEMCETGPVHVLFIDGIGGWNPTTAGQIDIGLRAALPSAAGYSRVTARGFYSELPPFAGGVLPVVRALAASPRSLFESADFADALLQSIERVVLATSSFQS